MIASVGVAQRRHRDDRREPAAVLADVGQLVDVLDAARRLEHQRFESRRDRRTELEAERGGPRDQFLRIGDVGRRDRVHHVGGGVAEHPLGTDVENLDDAVGIGGDAGKVGAVEDRALQRAGLQQRLCAPDVEVVPFENPVGALQLDGLGARALPEVHRQAEQRRHRQAAAERHRRQRCERRMAARDQPQPQADRGRRAADRQADRQPPGQRRQRSVPARRGSRSL